MEPILFVGMGLIAGLLAGNAAGDRGVVMLSDGVSGSFVALVTGAALQYGGWREPSATMAALVLVAAITTLLLLAVLTPRLRTLAEHA